MRRSSETAIYGRRVAGIVDGKFVHEIRDEEVRVLARAEGYAMVRKKGGATFAVRENELRPLLMNASASLRKEGKKHE